jgi:uncharacterized protein (DUF169 family)
MEFRFQTRAEAKKSPFFFTDEECNNGGTAYGWAIIIEDELKPEEIVKRDRLSAKADPMQWDSYCAALARRFSKKNKPLLHYEDLFQEARLKVCELLAANTYPEAVPFFQPEEQYSELSEEEQRKLSKEAARQYRRLQDNVRFRAALRRSLLDYVGKA